MTTNPRVAIYVRVSTDKQDAENQLHDLKTYCARAGYTAVNVYRDTISGSKSWASFLNGARQPGSSR